MISWGQEKLAEAYARFTDTLYSCGGISANETTDKAPQLPQEIEIQQLWASGCLQADGHTEHHGEVRILDVGEWNRGAGADFLRAEIELNGKVLRGDIEIDPHAQDWEKHGHGDNPNFNEVILHVVLARPPQGWYTRDSQHRNIPVLYMKPKIWQKAMGIAPAQSAAHLPCCQTPLAHADLTNIRSLLQAAAAHRCTKKRKLFQAKAEQIGQEQAWYEAIAATLGYSANKTAMQLLAARAPLCQIHGREEAILFGVSGFLMPVLPEKADEPTRLYHRHVWDAWWHAQQEYALHKEREIPWVYSATRPQNHPHRRVAALATIARQWGSLFPLFDAAGAQLLRKKLSALQHPYWDTHYSLPSAAAKKRMALVGENRITDFFINHIYVQDKSDAAWQSYLNIKCSGTIPGKVARTAAKLFGKRKDIQPLLKYAFSQQALLQIDADFCANSSCRNCLFPEQLAQWNLHAEA